MVQVCDGIKTKGGMLEEAITQYKDIFMRARNGFNNVLTVGFAYSGYNAAHLRFPRAFKTGWNPLRVGTIGVVARVEAVAVVEPGEVGEAVDQVADLGREVGVVGPMTVAAPMKVPVVVQGVGVGAVVVVVVVLQGDEEVHHRRHHQGHQVPQTI